MSKQRDAERRDLEPRTVSANGTLVLKALADGHSYGFEIMEITELPSGTVYPLLRRLEARGLARSSWEAARSVRGQGRPRRRYYEMTAVGGKVLERSIARHRERQRVFGRLLGAERPAPEDRSR